MLARVIEVAAPRAAKKGWRGEGVLVVLCRFVREAIQDGLLTE